MRASETTASLVSSERRARRLADLLDLLAVQGSATIEQLTATLDTSAATVRRDLAVLADRRLIIRTHGGASAAENKAEVPVTLRDQRRRESKRRIGRAAARLIPRERQVVALSGGTTTAELVRALNGYRGLTIVTNSLTIATLASAYPTFKVVVIGGMLRPQSLEMVGLLAERSLGMMSVAIAVLGADGVSVDGGVTTHDQTEAQTNSVMLGRARRRIVIADGSKIGAVAQARIAAVGNIETLVTDSTADPLELARIRRLGVDVQVLESPAEDLGAVAGPDRRLATRVDQSD